MDYILESNLRPGLQDRDVRKYSSPQVQGPSLKKPIAAIDEHPQPTGADSFAKFER